MSRRLVITADDFGLHPAVNRAVEKGHRQGVLSAASLMMGAPATVEAVAIARRLAGLHVGLHLMVADGWASSPPGQVPGLADAAGVMDGRIVRRSFRFLRPSILRQLRRELRAQFDAFTRTGLTLDHVNVHKHLHLHPVVLSLVIEQIHAHGNPPLRVPCEPHWVRATRRGAGRWTGAALLSVWARAVRRIARHSGVTCNDTMYGLAHTGGIDQSLMLRFLSRLPPGLSEIYLHPADSAVPVNDAMTGYRPQDELHALLDVDVRLALGRAGVVVGGYRETPEDRVADQQQHHGAPAMARSRSGVP